MSNYDLSIIIPAYQEEKRLPDSLNKLEYFLFQTNLDIEIIIVVEDLSDNTFGIAKEFAETHDNIVVLLNEQRMGKGYSVKRGVLAATAPIIGFIDADFSFNIVDILDYYQIIKDNKAECVIPLRIQDKTVPFYRSITSLIFRSARKLIVGINVHDTQSGFKVFSSEFVRNVFPRVATDGFAFDIDVLAWGETLGYRIKELPTIFGHNGDSRVSFVKDSIDMFKHLFTVRKNINKYKNIN
mgnify:FL=1